VWICTSLSSSPSLALSSDPSPATCCKHHHHCDNNSSPPAQLIWCFRVSVPCIYDPSLCSSLLAWLLVVNHRTHSLSHCFFRHTATLAVTRKTVLRFRGFAISQVSQFCSTQVPVHKSQYLPKTPKLTTQHLISVFKLSGLALRPLLKLVPSKANGATCEILPPIQAAIPLLFNCSCPFSSRISLEARTFQLIHQCLRLQTCPIIT
jgi:hypothetical protein